jgi:glycolate oxidase
MDGTIPKSQLAYVLNEMVKMEAKYQLGCANVFHAGDGNLHPLILFDANDPDSVRRAEDFGADILELCIKVGGTVTGEHGVGLEKINQMCSQFTREELDAFTALKKAFDPDMLLNPTKQIPTLNRCAEYGRMHVHGGQIAFPDIERF